MKILSSNTNYLGIDIGSTSIKVVELKKDKNHLRLVNYAFSELKNPEQRKKNGEIGFLAAVINKIFAESGITTIDVVASLPTYSVFSSILNLSNVNKKEIAQAVHWEAKKVIPLPLEEMILDWKEIKSNNQDEQDIKVLLTGAPRSLVKKYIDIFAEAQLNLHSLETETFSLIRSLIGSEKSTTMIVEMGAYSTDVTIVDNSIPMFSRSVDVGGANITQAISTQLNIAYERAEQFKFDMGLTGVESDKEAIPRTIVETISPIINEIKYASNLYLSKNNRKIEKIILSGGSAMIPNLVPYLTKILDTKVIIGNPWERISYQVELKPLLDEIGSKMSVAIGLAKRGLI